MPELSPAAYRMIKRLARRYQQEHPGTTYVEAVAQCRKAHDEVTRILAEAKAKAEQNQQVPA